MRYCCKLCRNIRKIWYKNQKKMLCFQLLGRFLPKGREICSLLGDVTNLRNFVDFRKLSFSFAWTGSWVYVGRKSCHDNYILIADCVSQRWFYFVGFLDAGNRSQVCGGAGLCCSIVGTDSVGMFVKFRDSKNAILSSIKRPSKM